MQRFGKVDKCSYEIDEMSPFHIELLTINHSPLTNSLLGKEFPVLDGELAVPCNPESAIPGSNSHLRFFRLLVGGWVCGVEDQVLRNLSSPNPARTGR